MKFPLKIFQLVAVLFFVSHFAVAQPIADQLKIVYGYHVPDKGKMSAERYAYLVATHERSCFVAQRSDFPRPENKIETDGDNTVSIKVFNSDNIGSYVFRDFSTDSIVFREVGSQFMDPILVTDQWEKIAWDITGETKRIGEYECTKATGKFRGRNYTVWFTEEIPIPAGPWKLYGLPGIILEAADSKMEFYAFAKEITANAASREEIAAISNHTEARYNFEEYKLYMKNYREAYVSAVRAKLPRGSIPYLKPSDIKISPIETELD